MKQILKAKTKKEEQMSQEMREKDNALNRQTEEIRRLRDLVEGLRRDFESKTKQFKLEKGIFETNLRDIESNVGEMKKKFEMNRQEGFKRGKKMEKIGKDKADLIAKVRDLENENIGLRRKREEEKKKIERVLDGERERAKWREDVTAEEVQKLKEREEEQRGQITKLNSEIERYKFELGELEQAVVFAKGSQMVDQKTLTQFKKQLGQLEKKKGKWKKKKSEFEGLRKENQSLREKLIELEQTGSRLKEEIRTERGRVEEKEGQVRMLAKKVERQLKQIREQEKDIMYLEVGKSEKRSHIEETRGKASSDQ